MIVLVGVVAFMFGVVTGVLFTGMFAAASRADDLAELQQALWAQRDNDHEDINW